MFVGPSVCQLDSVKLLSYVNILLLINMTFYGTLSNVSSIYE